MANLIFVANMSLDGFTEDKDGKFDWTEPSEELFRFVTNIVRVARTHLYGRRMYETMMVWETDPNLAAMSPLRSDFAEIWQAADKIVHSRTLETISTRKTQLEQTFDPEAIRQLKATSEHDILIGGPELAAHAFRAGLINECHLFVTPIILGGGKFALPGNLRADGGYASRLLSFFLALGFFRFDRDFSLLRIAANAQPVFWLAKTWFFV
jgi:dihydrofolate reductase